MLLKMQLILLSFITSEAYKQHTRSQIVLKLDTNQIIDALNSKGTLRYIENLAQKFATTAAEHFIDVIKNKEREIDTDYKLQTKLKKLRDRTEKRVLGEDEAMVLVEEPPPDGDNLGLKFDELTDDEFQVEKKTIPVIGLTKVNGRYYYRRLGMI